MRITLERSALLKSLAHMQSVVERRNTIPILSNVLIEASDGQLSLVATDLDIEIVERIPADIVRPGATTAPAHMLYDIVRKMPDGAQVQLDLAGGDPRLTISAARSRFQLSCLPKDDFPTMQSGALPHRFALSPAEIVRMIDKTRFAISTEETRYYLNGIYLHANAKEKPSLRAVATDGHRLARVEVALPDGAREMPGVIVPRKTVNELRKLVDGAEGPVEVALSDAKIRFQAGGVTLTSKLIDGSFPDYERVIPKANDKPLTCSAKLFAESVDRVSTIASDRSRAVKLMIEKDRLTLSVTNPDAGSAQEELPVDYRSDPLEIGFNARYLLDVTGQISGAELRFLMADPASPTIVEEAGDEADSGVLFVLMPMRV